MPLKIELLDCYKLRTKDNDPDALELPVIELAPSDTSNFPHISTITISVSGTPEYLAKKIQSAYRVFNSTNLIKLFTLQRLKQSDCRLDQPLPADVNCTLSVSIDYFDSDEIGNPNLSASNNVKAECHLFSLVENKAPIQSSQIQQTLQPSVENKAPISAPKNQEIPQFPISPPAPVPPFEIKPTTQPLVEKKAKDYPGWFAIDFGTSNSTVTLYDPKRVDPPNNLPKEQEERLRELLAKWVNERPTDDSLNISDTEWKIEWQKLLSEVSKNFKYLSFDKPETLGNQIFLGTDSTHLLEAIRLVEISLNSSREWFQRATSKQLNQIYYKVSRVPPLDWQSLIPVELDLLRHVQEIPSELEIESFDPSLGDDNPAKVKVLMGERARQDRKNALAKSQETSGIREKFHHSPKRYFGLNRPIEVTLNGTKAKIPVQNLIQAAYAHLIQLTNDYRKARPERFAAGDFYTGVITYPTIAPPVVRREIKDLVTKLGIQNVQIAYDEAVAVAIFYLLREFGGDLNIGIESFKTRCRRQGDQWSQNVLILDIGGGTTDMAVIRLTLEEINPFDSNDDRGNGGRYYKLTPKLLGSSGHLQLGGELITLQIFLLLKAAIADCLLSAVAEEKINDERLNSKLNEINERFLKNGKFQSGTLLACVDKPNPEEADAAAYKDALNDAEKIVSTRFQKFPERLQTFYTLWEYAEKAKLILGKKRDPKETTEPTFVLNGQQISELFVEQNNTSSPTQSIENLSVTLTLQQFEKAVTPIITKAIGIAKGLIKNRLEGDEEKVDWLILSGKTCNLYLVEPELYKKFSESKYFLWNTERITFVPEYSKLATSIGACYAEKLRQLTFDPQAAKPLLRKGANQLYFDVKNLLYFLPCSFYREAIGAQSEIFKAGQPLSLVDQQDSVVKIRSTWQGLQLSNIIQRVDFEGEGEGEGEGAKPQLWGSFNGKALADELKIGDDQLRNQIKIQFEVDQNLEFSLLLCKGDVAHYLIPSHIPTLNAGDKIGMPVISDSDNKVEVVCDIAVCVAESATALNTDAHTVVFEADKNYSQELKVFWNEDGNSIEQKGLINTLAPFPLSGRHTFYFQFRQRGANSWELIGELPQPKIRTEYPCTYYVSLDEQGILRIHAGEVSYRTSDNKQCLLKEGYVFRTPLDPQPSEVEEKRDPFSGIH